jgi:hypothetical protein
MGSKSQNGSSWVEMHQPELPLGAGWALGWAGLDSGAVDTLHSSKISGRNVP